MIFSTTARLGCVAAVAMTVSLQSWSAQRFFQPIEQPLGSIAPIVLSDTDLSGNTTKGYRPWFENGSWQGDLVEYTVTSDGALSTSVSFNGTSPTNSGSNWSALVQFAAKNASTYWDAERKIITYHNGSQKPFRFSEDEGIGSDNMALLDPGAEENASDILNFVRGDRSNEYPSGTMRKRTSILGDIIHSKPVYVGAPNANITEEDYAEWAQGRVDREARVYVGANDGMLHVFDAENGNEVYAYVPSMLTGKLATLAARPYTHRYFVDGELSVRDAFFDDEWHTVLAGSLGAGGKGFFVLDITDPDLSSEAANTGSNEKVLFEWDASADADLGDSFSRPIIAKLNDGDWYVVVGNGYNSVNGEAMLYLLNLDTLAITRISTGSGTAANPNGLSSPSLLDTNRDGTADYAFAGDIDGNLWKFDLSNSDPDEWLEAYGRPLHPSAGGQSIVHAPQITRHPQNGYMLYFATGRLFWNADLYDTSVQSLYGIWDSGTTPPTADQQSLLTQIWDGPKTYNYVNSGGSAATQTIAIYNEDAGDLNWETHDGWKVDFPAGYRVLQPTQIRANRVKATVYKPNAASGQQGENWLVEAVLSDGGPNPPTAPIYDLNVDAVLNTADLYDNNPEEEAGEWHVPMMWQQASGLMSQVTIAFLRSGFDTLFINYLQQPITLDIPCTGPGLCENGFLGGHIDVQTYRGNVPLDGDRTADSHQYDSLTRRVYVDFFELYFRANLPNSTTIDPSKSVLDQVDIDFADSNRSGQPGHPTATASDIDENEKFIVLLANADLSPASTLRIGNKRWNVAEYQRQLHDALKKWDPTDPLTVPLDADGEPLVFTWRGIKNAGGTISHNFNDRAILDGGLHPTQPECVVYDPVQSGRNIGDRANTGRWRNGALTTQLVKLSYFTDNPVAPAIAMVDVQQPADLAPFVITQDGDTVPTRIDYQDNQYETVGGLLAQHDAEHIWESTLFWHFGDLTDIVGLGRPCYGDSDWAAAVAFELSNDPISATLEALGKDLSSDTLAAAVEALRLDGCNDSASACNGEWTLLKSILDISADYTRKQIASVIGPPTPPIGGAPVFVPGGATGAGLRGDGGDGAITEGIPYEPGRMSWTDVVK
ncbi:Type IV pilus biogenesis factor PilY1 [Halioglobus japonicus]|nr:Type IV pilus biogenesis factor PilY1 [Halioglobus japonicus]